MELIQPYNQVVFNDVPDDRYESNRHLFSYRVKEQIRRIGIPQRQERSTMYVALACSLRRPIQ